MSKNVSGEKQISFDRLRKISASPTSTVHFIGIGGVSMYSLARLAMLSGAKVSGSDRENCERVRMLSEQGAKIFIGHDKDNVKGASLVVYTHAISKDNPELLEAARLDIPTVTRAEYMGALMTGFAKRIGVSGSHGKSTTVAMLDAIFTRALCDPTVLSGAALTLGEPLKIGSNDLMIYEACEYKDSFLKFAPTISLGLNLELDHTDYFESIADMKDSFRRALGKATAFSVINGDDENLSSIAKLIHTRVVTYGQDSDNDYTYSVTSFKRVGFEFSLSHFGTRIYSFEINIPGIFNVANAVGAIVTALEYGIDKEIIREAIADFSGIERRLQYVGERFGRAVYYDYAHHPTEISSSISALRMMTHELVTVIFKPHTYSRTASLWEGFRSSLSLADYVILTDIYPAREKAIEGVTSERLSLSIGQRALYSPDSDVVGYLDSKTHGIIIIMGAGDMEKIKEDVLYKYF